MIYFLISLVSLFVGYLFGFLAGFTWEFACELDPRINGDHEKGGGG